MTDGHIPPNHSEHAESPEMITAVFLCQKFGMRGNHNQNFQFERRPVFTGFKVWKGNIQNKWKKREIKWHIFITNKGGSYRHLGSAQNRSFSFHRLMYCLTFSAVNPAQPRNRKSIFTSVANIRQSLRADRVSPLRWPPFKTNYRPESWVTATGALEHESKSALRTICDTVCVHLSLFMYLSRLESRQSLSLSF